MLVTEGKTLQNDGMSTAGDVDAVRRHQLVLDLDVDGREAELAAHALAAVDAAVDVERTRRAAATPPRRGRGRPRAAPASTRSPRRRRAAARRRRPRSRARARSPRESRRRPAGPAPKRKLRPEPDLAGREACGTGIPSQTPPPSWQRSGGRTPISTRVVDAAARSSSWARWPRSSPGAAARIPGRSTSPGAGSKVSATAGHRAPRRVPTAPFDEHLVAAMDAVEVADRHHAAARQVGARRRVRGLRPWVLMRPVAGLLQRR